MIDHDDAVLEPLRFHCRPLILQAIEDPEVIEIMLNPDGKLWVERFGHDHEYVGDIPLEKTNMILSIVASALKIVVTERSPIVEGCFPLDGSRFEGVFPPLAHAPSFSLRKKASKVFPLLEYQEKGTLTPEAVSIIENAVVTRKNIVVVGGTSSGKTTFLNAVIEAVSRLTPTDRIVTLEDTQELQCTSPNRVNLFTSDLPGAEITMRNLAKVCMRYAPKRILVGEVRDAAALELLKLWNTGHPGGVATFHADAAFEALTRLEELVEEAGLGPKRGLIGRAVDLVVFMKKTADNRRLVTSILQVNGYNNKTEDYETETLYAV